MIIFLEKEFYCHHEFSHKKMMVSPVSAIVGGAVGDVVTDGYAGLFEGNIAEYLRKHGIDEARTPLSTSMGKMSGCLIGIGIVLTIAWSLLDIGINFW